MANTKIVDDPVLHQLRMERTLMERLDKLSTAQRRSRNQVIIELIQKGFENIG